MLRPVKGTKDIISDDYKKLQHIYQIAYNAADKYGFIPIETPIFEYSEVFTKTLGDSSDIITKEMYSFSDKSDNKLTLRPEFTAAIGRAFITNNLSQLSSPLKLICHGPLFRYERPQKGRQRQFNQINCEMLGEDGYTADVEMISLATNILTKLNILDKVTLELNSLGDQVSYTNYRTELISYFSQHQAKLSQESQQRLKTNPLRILDSKDKTDKVIIKNAPKIHEYYNQNSAIFFKQVQEGLEGLGIKYIINPYLVRGLDYYSHTVFEFTTDYLGAQSAVLAGGRYNHLIKNMGGKDTPAIGFAGGVERISEIMDYSPLKWIFFAIIPLSEKGLRKSLAVAHNLRLSGINVQILSKGNLNKRLKKSEDALAVIIIGENEIINKTVTIKEMRSGVQEIINDNEILHKAKELIISLRTT